MDGWISSLYWPYLCKVVSLSSVLGFLLHRIKAFSVCMVVCCKMIKQTQTHQTLWAGCVCLWSPEDSVLYSGTWSHLAQQELCPAQAPSHHVSLCHPANSHQPWSMWTWAQGRPRSVETCLWAENNGDVGQHEVFISHVNFTDNHTCQKCTHYDFQDDMVSTYS